VYSENFGCTFGQVAGVATLPETAHHGFDGPSNKLVLPLNYSASVFWGRESTEQQAGSSAQSVAVLSSSMARVALMQATFFGMAAVILLVNLKFHAVFFSNPA
jgi:hypothetical protein